MRFFKIKIILENFDGVYFHKREMP